MLDVTSANNTSQQACWEWISYPVTIVYLVTTVYSIWSFKSCYTLTAQFYLALEQAGHLGMSKFSTRFKISLWSGIRICHSKGRHQKLRWGCPKPLACLSRSFNLTHNSKISSMDLLTTWVTWNWTYVLMPVFQTCLHISTDLIGVVYMKRAQ